MGMRFWTYPTFLLLFSISRRKGAGRRWREKWPSKIDSNWGKHCSCCWSGRKWPSNRIKNDSRIFEHQQNIELRILKEDLGKRNLCARFVPHSLTPEQREDRVTSCQDTITMADVDKNFLRKLIWEMKSGVLCMTPKKSDGVLNGSVRHPLGRRNWNSKEHFDFFDSQGVVHKEFVPEGKTVNAKFYKGVMDRLLKSIQRIRPAAFCSRDFFLLQDNAPAHRAASVCLFLTPKNVKSLNHTPNSPDLSPPDYFLFPKLKMKLKEPHFADVAEIQEAVTDELEKAQKEEFLRSFSETVRPRKILYICQWSLFWIKKGICLPHVSSIF